MSKHLKIKSPSGIIKREKIVVEDKNIVEEEKGVWNMEEIGVEEENIINVFDTPKELSVVNRDIIDIDVRKIPDILLSPENIQPVTKGYTDEELLCITECLYNKGYEKNNKEICFSRGTLIKCYLNRRERYIPIENIEQGTWVRTYNNEFKRVKYILNSKSNGTENHSMTNLYCMRKEKSPDLLCDLYVTGGHAILYDKLTAKQQKNMTTIDNYCKNHDIKYDMTIDGKFKLLACYDTNFKEVKKEEPIEIYHIVLENKNKECNYGIYANGILVESTEEINVARTKGNMNSINENEKAQKKMKMKTKTC